MTQTIIRSPSLTDMTALKLPISFQQWLRELWNIVGHIETYSLMTTDNAITTVWEKTMAANSQFVGIVLWTAADGSEYAFGAQIAGLVAESGAITGDIPSSTDDPDDSANWIYASNGTGFGAGFLTDATDKAYIWVNGDAGKTVHHNGLVLYSYMER